VHELEAPAELTALMRSADAWASKVEIKYDPDTPDAEAEALRACGG